MRERRMKSRPVIRSWTTSSKLHFFHNPRTTRDYEAPGNLLKLTSNGYLAISASLRIMRRSCRHLLFFPYFFILSNYHTRAHKGAKFHRSSIFGRVRKKTRSAVNAKIKIKRWRTSHKGLPLAPGFPGLKAGSKQFFQCSIRGPFFTKMGLDSL